MVREEIASALRGTARRSCRRRYHGGGLGRVVLLGLLAVACARTDDEHRVFHPEYRLVDRLAGAERLSDLPAQRIDDETRYVLRNYPVIPIEPLTGQGPFSVRQVITGDVGSATRAVVAGRYIAGGGRHEVEPRVVELRRGEGGHLELDLSVPGPPDESVTLLLRGTGLPDGALAREETDVLAIPAGAVLEFGIGIDPLAWAEPPVTFEVLVCEQEQCESVFRKEVDPADASGRGWQDHRVSLERWAGQAMRLRFDAHLPTGEGTYSLPYWSNPTILAPEPGDPSPRNVILVSLDTLGARHLPSFGYSRSTAPFLDGELAQRATVFANCFTAAPTTGPSHMTALTSLQPSVHGLTGNLVFKRITPSTRTLAGVLREAGIETGAITEDGPLAAMHGFARGFNSYKENRGTETTRAVGFIDRTLDEGRRWLARHRDRRFFLFLHTFQVHTPYEAPAAYARYFTDPLPGEDRIPAIYRPTLYDREIRYVDDQLRRFFADLDDMHLLENTLVVVMSDHGEAFGEHGSLFHGGVLHDEVLRVLLIMTGPGIPGGGRVEGPVGLLDLMPTLLDWLGVPVPPGLMGRSFAAAAAGTEAEVADDRPIFSETWTPLMTRLTDEGLVREMLEEPAFTVRRGGRKLIRRGPPETPRFQYYDLRADPEERNDLYERDPQAAADLQALLAAYEASMVTLREAVTAGEEMPELPRELIDPERLEKLRALGYIQ